MFEATEKERKEAADLGITVGQQSGPQLREEIRQAKLRAKVGIVNNSLRHMAERYDVEVRPTDRSPSLERRIAAKIEALLVEKGITPQAVFVIDASHTCHGNSMGSVTTGKIHWMDGNPIIYVRIPAKPRVKRINACTLLDFGRIEA